MLMGRCVFVFDSVAVNVKLECRQGTAMFVAHASFLEGHGFNCGCQFKCLSCNLWLQAMLLQVTRYGCDLLFNRIM